MSDYFIFTGYATDALPAIDMLSKKVQNAIAEGWKPTGGVSIVFEHRPVAGLYTAVQAMTREKANE